MVSQARPPSLKHAVLGLLDERRGYGYELAQRLERRAGAAWQTTPGAVYQALAQLEKDGLVQARPTSEPAVAAMAGGRRGSPRIPYEITPEGQRHFTEWIGGPCAFVPVRDDLHLRLAVSRAQHLPRLIDITIEQERECVKRLDDYRGAPAFEDLVGTTSALEAFARVAIRDAEVASLEATVKWLRQVRKTMRWMVENPERFLSRGR